MEILEKESIWLKGFPPLMEKVGSATPGKPCVQNDMRVRSKLEEKPSSLKCGATNAKIKTAFVE